MKKILTLVILVITLTSCSISKKLSDIPEASWLCQNDSYYYTVSDKWIVYKLKNDWYILKENNLWKEDLEWIVCNINGLYALVESGKLIELDYDLNVLNTYKLEDRDKYFTKKAWAEGITYVNWYFYISSQSEENNLLKYEMVSNTTHLKLIDKYSIPYKDLSWLDYYNNLLYIVSDKNNKIYKYDINSNKIVWNIDLGKWNWEWISINKNWDIYLADDKWFIIKK